MAQKTRLAALLPTWEGSEKRLEWLLAHGLVVEQQQCPNCLGPIHLVECVSSTDGYVWRCRQRGCQKRLSLRQNTIFENSRLSISKILQLMYRWARELPVGQAADEVAVELKTTIDWYCKFREACANFLLQTEQPMLGVPITSLK